MQCNAGTPVSVAIIDAHSGVPGAGIGTSAEHEDETTLVAVLGTSGCFMLNTARDAHVPGMLGKVRGGIFPGSFGYEMGQSSCGDAFTWLSRVTGRAIDSLGNDGGNSSSGSNGSNGSNGDFTALAAKHSSGSSGAAHAVPLALDW